MWLHQDNILKREFVFKDFKDAFSFMAAVALEAERVQHHPNWSNVYNKVVIELCTHDAGDVLTQKDHDLAKAIDLVFRKYEK